MTTEHRTPEEWERYLEDLVRTYPGIASAAAQELHKRAFGDNPEFLRHEIQFLVPNKMNGALWERHDNYLAPPYTVIRIPYPWTFAILKWAGYRK